MIALFSLTCPKCGHKFLWCNGGDVIVSRSQLFPVCPKCKHEALTTKFKPCLHKADSFKMY